ncbi:putative internal head protein [Escherichia phage vB_EcoM_112]|uniref:Putative internal head protein n=1 Tax=Escherichia phage vB_EcoM_112 TaxID=1495285 RepID=A0A023ZUA2_9CAUD|nr:internal virion protein [Escherichia phage vB_EcoM_112]AHY83341.1 putative internal head protein [Escherichia phage vB_EcoM_112]
MKLENKMKMYQEFIAEAADVKVEFIYIGKKDKMGEMPHGVLRDALDNFGQLGGEEFGDYFVIYGPEKVIEKWADKYKSIFRKK